MRKVFFAVLFLGILAHSKPIDLATQSVNHRVDITSPYIYVDPNCESRIDAIETAIADAVRLAAPLKQEYFIEGKHQLSASRYFGIDQSDSIPLTGSAQYIMENLEMASLISGPYADEPDDDWTRMNMIRITCKDEWGTCAELGSQTFAYARNDADWMGKPLYAIALCTTLFDTTGSLDDLLEQYGGSPREEVDMQFLNPSSGGGFLHELMHIDLITQHRGHMQDEPVPNNGKVRLYGPARISRTAKNREYKETLMRNPDSYKQFAHEVFFTKELGFRPPVKKRDSPRLGCASDASNGPEFHLHRWNHRDSVTGPIEEFCTNLGENYRNDGNYQTDSLWPQTFNEGTPGEFVLIAEWKWWADMSAGHIIDDCKTKMYQILDSCDTDTLWKHGGMYDSFAAMATRYSIDMVNERPDPVNVPAANCDVWYNFPKPYNQVYMKGAGFASSDWGQDVLMGALGSCGGLTDWHFQYHLHEYEGVLYEWEASGRIVIGHQQWGCVRDAMVKAGAPETLGCGGR